MTVLRRAVPLASLAVLVLLTHGCDDDPTGPEFATVGARLTLTGNSPDPDGAAVRLDGGAWQPLYAGHELTLGEVEEGSHVVELGELADNCQLAGENPRVVAVEPGEAMTVSFEASCSTPAGDSELWALLQQVGPYQEGEARADTVDQGDELEDRADGLWTCTVRRVSSEQYPDDYATFNPNAEVIYPGSMLQGATLVDATPEPVLVNRAGGTLVINLVNGSSGVYQHVDQVKQSTVVQAINDILGVNDKIGAARFTYASSEVQSREQLAASLGVNVSTLSASFKTSLAFSADREYNRFLVRLNQSFYTVSFDLPLGLEDLFAPSVTAGDLEPYVGPGNPATYISSVTYGRTFYLLIESTATADEMRASIKASYSGLVASGQVEAGATYVNELENVNIKVFALGGDQSLAAATFRGGEAELGEFLTDGADILTGVPLSYVVRNVVDNRIVNVKVATEYDVKTCVPVIVEQLASDFESDDEGWTAYSNAGAAIQHVPEAECTQNPGGGACIAQTDIDWNGGMQFRAPIEWRDGRSWQAFYGGRISYYYRLVGGTPPPQPDDAVGIIIEGATGFIRAKLPLPVIQQAHDVGWTFIEWVLDESGTTFVHAPGQVMPWTTASGAVATREDIEAVLQRVTDVRIVGEFYVGGDTAYLDRVRVEASGDTGVGVGW